MGKVKKQEARRTSDNEKPTELFWRNVCWLFTFVTFVALYTNLKDTKTTVFLLTRRYATTSQTSPNPKPSDPKPFPSQNHLTTHNLNRLEFVVLLLHNLVVGFTLPLVERVRVGAKETVEVAEERLVANPRLFMVHVVIAK